MSEISNVCNAVEGHCIQAIKIVRHHANDRFDWLISGHQSINPSREILEILDRLDRAGHQSVNPSREILEILDR